MGRSAGFYTILMALALLAGCAPSGGGQVAGHPNSGVSGSCEQVCNSEYDACADRFAGVGGDAGAGRRSDDPASALGPNDICPDQLKSCIHRCLP